MRATLPVLPLLLASFTVACGGSAEQATPSSGEAGGVVETPLDARAECERLQVATLPFAKELLSSRGDFLPYGGSLTANGELGARAGWTGDDHPQAGEVLELLEERFAASAERGELRATAIVFGVAVTPPGKDAKQNAIAVALDHRDGHSRIVFHPYSFTQAGELVLESAFELEGAHSVFAPREMDD